MQARTVFPKAAGYVAAALARELTTPTGASPAGSHRPRGAEDVEVVLRGGKTVSIPGWAPDLEHLEAKYREVGAINHYVEQPNAPGLIKLVIMNFND